MTPIARRVNLHEGAAGLEPNWRLVECSVMIGDGLTHEGLYSGEQVAALNAEIAELVAQRDRLAKLLSETAVALRGPEPPLTRWSWHDLPERAAAAIAAFPLVQAAERERCAEICEQTGDLAAEMYGDGAECIETAGMCAAAICGA